MNVHQESLSIKDNSEEMITDTVAEVRDLRLKFPGETSFVFKDLSFSVRRGEKMLLLGPSGSGKSTLLQVLSGIIPNLIEVPMRCAEKILPPSWGLLFQDPDTQFCMPYVDEELAFVLENLAVPQSEMSQRMKEVLEKVGLQLGELHVPIDSLSQGMKQRLALASVLLSNPEVLFLDEPSALLDPEGRKQIWKSVQAIAENRTLIIVEHRIEEIIGFVDKVVLFNPDGQIVGQGHPHDVFRIFRRELQEYGIWYPGVWKDFLSSPDGQTLSESVKPASVEEISSIPHLVLSAFRGMRYGGTAIEVDHAEVYPGDFIAITGPNGAGKSSLLLSLMGLLAAEGTYILRETRMDKLKNRKRKFEMAAHEIGFVFQNPEFQFIADQVSEEIIFSLREEGLTAEEVSTKVAEILVQFGLQGLEYRHPYQLSLGQKRRLSVAGAAVLKKPLLLLDEPTFGQDAVNTFAILKFCEEMRSQGMAIMMVTHEEMIADTVATHRWEISEGRLVSQQVTKRGRNRDNMNLIERVEGSFST
ncbi:MULTISPECIES: ABC transporter ATP-binding protein [Paenibacillus]